MDCFETLGISPTKDVKEIRRAYSRLLTQHSPETDPEGFQRLRSAYDEALIKSREEEAPSLAELSEADSFMKDFEAAYKCFEKRLDIDCWKELLSRDICYQIDTANEIGSRVLAFIMDNYNFPSQIWSLFNEHFSWTSKKEALYNQYPRNFIDFVIYKITKPSSFNYDSLRKCMDNEQDVFIAEYRKIADALEYFDLYTADKAIKKAKEICPDHPDLQILIGRYLILTGKIEAADKLFTDCINNRVNDMEPYYNRGELYLKVGKLEEAYRDYKKALYIDTDSPGVWYSLGKCCICLKKNDEAVEYLEKAYNASSYNREIRIVLDSAYNYYIESLRETAEQNSFDSNVKYKLADAYYKTSKVEESYNILNELMQNCELSSEMYLLYVQVLMAQKNMDLAYTTVCSAVDLYNDDYGLNYFKADILDELGRYEEAIAQYDRAIEVGSEVSSAYNNKAFVLNKLGRYTEALECANRAISLDPKTSQFHKNRAAALLGLEHYEDCLEACEEALSRYQYLTEAYVIKMKALTGINLYDESLGAYNRASELGLRDGRLYLEKARILMFRRQYDEAVDYCNSAIELDENNADFYYLKGLCNYYMDNYDAAIELFDAAIERNKYYAEAYFYKAYSFIYSSRQNEALSVLDEAIDLRLQNVDRFYNLKGGILKNQKKYEEAIAEYKNAIANEPSSARYYYSLGHAYNELDNYDEAINYLNKSIDLDPSQSDCFVSKSYSLFSLRKFDECIECCSKAIEIDPEDITAYQNKGWAYYELKNLEAAEKECSAALKLDPNNMNLLLLKLRILEQKNLYQDALIVCDRMLELDPENQNAKTIRAELLGKKKEPKNKKLTLFFIIAYVIYILLRLLTRVI